MAELKINLRGPYVVAAADVTLIGPDGTAVTPPREVIALCRCGHSQNKPFCDGSHNRVEWDSSLTALAPKEPE